MISKTWIYHTLKIILFVPHTGTCISTQQIYNWKTLHHFSSSKLKVYDVYDEAIFTLQLFIFYHYFELPGPFWMSA